jgi:hypothetical protein
MVCAAIGLEPTAAQIGGSARGYHEPLALRGSHSYPARRAVGRPNIYALVRFGRSSSFAADGVRRHRLGTAPDADSGAASTLSARIGEDAL